VSWFVGAKNSAIGVSSQLSAIEIQGLLFISAQFYQNRSQVDIEVKDEWAEATRGDRVGDEKAD
jgi:hypothetical protein